ncbi:hypothetical protein [Streptomyces sp. NPDC005784]|uniref:hypothetical protein n=1 Tax=Streptomyces sp. NPDC005784 TaxID=3364731 RepID=UPI00369DA264
MEAAGAHLREAWPNTLPAPTSPTRSTWPTTAPTTRPCAAADDGETYAYLNLALLHEELEQWEQADRRYRDAIRHRDELAFANYALFLSEQGRGSEIGALLAPTAELDLDPEDISNLSGRLTLERCACHLR